MLTLIISTLTALLISSLCSLMESVLLSLNTFRLETLKEKGYRSASVWLTMKRDIDRPIAAILILNTVAHTGGATIAGGAFDQLFGTEWIWLFSLIFTVAVLVGTEILPKVIGVSHNERIAVWLGPILIMVTQVLRPIVFITELISNPFKKKESNDFSSADIQTLARMARSQNIIGAVQESIIVNATHFRTTPIDSVMIPVDRIVFFSLQRPIEANVDLAHRTLHTRYPVSRTHQLDDIYGYVNLKEIATLADDPKRPDIKPFIRALPTMRSGTSLNRAFRLLAGKHRHMAIIKDHDDHVLGLVTLEDLMEEVMGEIEDEFDETSSEIIPMSSKSWKIGGATPLDELVRRVPLDIPEDQQDQTFGQWITQQLGRKPAVHISFVFGRYQITIQQIRRGKIHYTIVEAIE